MQRTTGMPPRRALLYIVRFSDGNEYEVLLEHIEPVLVQENLYDYQGRSQEQVRKMYATGDSAGVRFFALLSVTAIAAAFGFLYL